MGYIYNSQIGESDSGITLGIAYKVNPNGCIRSIWFLWVKMSSNPLMSST